MSPLQAITSCLRKSFQFSGRASRSEYLASASVFCLLGTAIYFAANLARSNSGLFATGPLEKLLRVLLSASVFIPLFALNNAGIRREHDLVEKWQSVAVSNTNPFVSATLRSLIGAVLIAGFIPTLVVELARLPTSSYSIGLLIFIIFSVCFSAAAMYFVFLRFSLPSFPFPNNYGPNPLEVTP